MQINSGLPALYQTAVPATRAPKHDAVPPARAPTTSSGYTRAPQAYQAVAGNTGGGENFAQLLAEGELSPTARRALAAYGDNANQEKQAYLTQALGIDVYA